MNPLHRMMKFALAGSALILWLFGVCADQAQAQNRVSLRPQARSNATTIRQPAFVNTRINPLLGGSSFSPLGGSNFGFNGMANATVSGNTIVSGGFRYNNPYGYYNSNPGLYGPSPGGFLGLSTSTVFGRNSFGFSGTPFGGTSPFGFNGGFAGGVPFSPFASGGYGIGFPGAFGGFGPGVGPIVPGAFGSGGYGFGLPGTFGPPLYSY
jgi:hypothetical protein